MKQSARQSGVIPLSQAVNKYFELSLYLLVLMGFGTLASTGGLDRPTILLVGAALAFRGYLLAERRHVVISERWTTPLTIAYFVFYAVDYFLLSRAFLAATVHLVMFAVVVRTFSLRRDRDCTVASPSRVPDGARLCGPHGRQCFSVLLCWIHVDGGGHLHPDGDAPVRTGRKISGAALPRRARASAFGVLAGSHHAGVGSDDLRGSRCPIFSHAPHVGRLSGGGICSEPIFPRDSATGYSWAGSDRFNSRMR